MQVVWLLEEICDCVVVAGEVRGRLGTADVAADVVVDGEMGDCAHAWETLVAIATAEKSVVIDQPEPAGVGSHTRTIMSTLKPILDQQMNKTAHGKEDLFSPSLS